MLSEADLAYVRQVQDEARPLAASLIPRREAPDGMGGTTWTEGTPVPVSVRLKGNESVPPELASRYGPGLVLVTLNLVGVRSGDRITVAADEAYQVVSDGDPSRWATAQQVWATRIVWGPDDG